MKIAKNSLPSQGGFSLVELMITVGIIGVLASVAGPNYTIFAERARNANRLSILAVQNTLIKSIYASDDRYPDTGGAWSSSEAGDMWWIRTDWIPGETELPHDPQAAVVPDSPSCGAGTKRAFLYRSDGANYKIMSHCASKYYSGYIDPLRDGGPIDESTPTACNGSGDGTNVWAAASFYSTDARCW